MGSSRRAVDASAQRAEDPGRRLSAPSRVAAGAGLAVAALVLWGGYARGWHWTGFARHATLWDWLHLLLLPLAVTAAPLWVRHRTRLGRRRVAVVVGVLVAFAVLVVAGYALDLRWTGFPGNRLWDWLELLVLPLAVATLPVLREVYEGLRPRHVAGLSVAAAALAVAVVGGYAYDWRWTGFQGNTLFDWLQLLLVPLLLPLVLVPLTAAWMTAGVTAGPDTKPAPEPAAPRVSPLTADR